MHIYIYIYIYIYINYIDVYIYIYKLYRIKSCFTCTWVDAARSLDGRQLLVRADRPLCKQTRQECVRNRRQIEWDMYTYIYMSV